MEEQYPLWLLLHLFLDFSAENGNKDVLSWDCFGFSHALHLLLGRISYPLYLQDAHTDAPCEDFRQWPYSGISLAVFLHTRSWHHQKSEKQKNASWNKISIKFYISKWTIENSRTNTMVTLCQKNVTCSYVLYISILKSASDTVQHCRLHVDCLSPTKFSPRCSVVHDWKGINQYCIEAYIVLCVHMLIWKICLCEKHLPVGPLLFLCKPPAFSAKKSGWRGYCRKKDVNGEVSDQTTIKTSTF